MFCIFMRCYHNWVCGKSCLLALKLFTGIADIATRNDLTRQTNKSRGNLFTPGDLSLSISYNLAEHNGAPLDAHKRLQLT